MPFNFFYNKQDPWELVQSLERNYQHGRSISDQIKEQFIYSPWDAVHEKHSWMGRIALWLRYPSEKTSSEQKALNTFIEIFKELYAQPESFQKLSFSFGKNIISEFEPFLEPPQDLEEPLPQSDQFLHFDELKLAREQNEEEEIKEWSLLGSLPSPPQKEVSAEILQAILCDDTELTDGNLKALEEYLKKNQDLASPDWEEKLKMIKEGQTEREKLLEGLRASSHNDSTKTVNSLGKKMVERINRLKPGESYQFNLRYGVGNFTYHSLFSFLKDMPKDLKEKLPEQVRKILDKEIPDPKDWVDSYIQELLKKLEPLAAEMTEILDGLPAALFQDSTRELPEWSYPILPELISGFLEHLLKDGLIKNSGFFSNSTGLAKIVEWINEEGRKTFKKEGAKGFLTSLEKKCRELALNPIQKVENEVNKQIGSAFDAVRHYIPPMLFEILGVDHLLHTGPIWYKVTRSPEDDTFELEIYSLGASLVHHKITNSKLVSWPLRFEGIQAEELSEELFGRILYHFVQPLVNPNLSLKVDDLFEGTFAGFLSKRSHSQAKKLSRFQQIPPNDFKLAASILFNEDVSKGSFLYDMKLEFFWDFCSPLFEDRKLKTEDPKILETLSQCTAKIKAEASQNLTQGRDRKRLKEILATCHEIEAEIARIRKSNQPLSDGGSGHQHSIPPQMLKEVHKVLSSQNITKEKLESYKSTLTWALGDNVGDFLEAVIKSFDGIIPSQENAVEEKKAELHEAGEANEQKPVQFDAPPTFTQIYINLMMVSLKYVFIIIQLSQISLKYVLMATLGRFLYPYISQFKVYQWYSRIQSAFVRSAGQYMAQIILDHLISKKARTRLETILKEWNESIALLKDKIEGHEKLSFKIESKESLEKPEDNKLPPIIVELAENQKTKEIGQALISQKDHEVPEPVSHPKINLPTLPPPKDPEALLIFLQHTKGTISSDNPAVVNINFLLHQISKLEIPKKGEGIWSEVAEVDIETCLKLVVEIGVKLNDLFVLEDSYEIRKYYHDQIITATYRLLAISDFLARRSPDWEISAPTNAYPLMRWITGRGKKFRSHKTWVQFLEVIHYFFPKFDPANPDKDLNWVFYSERHSLFSQGVFEDFTTRLQSQPEFINLNDFTAAPELVYLQQFMIDPVKKEKLKQLGWKEKSSNSAPSSRNSTLAMLFFETLSFTREEDLLPLSFRLLKLQTLISTQLATLRKLTAPTEKLLTASPYTPEFKDRNWKSYLGISSGYSLAFPESIKNAFQAFPAANDFIYNSICELIDTTFSQSELIDSEARILYFSTSWFGTNNQTDLLHIMTEPKDRILRMMEWIRKNKSVTGLRRACIVNDLFEVLLFAPNELPTQLQHSPDLARGINCFIKEMVEYHLSTKDYESCLYFIHKGVEIKKIIESVVPEQLPNCLNFYDILVYLKEIPEKCEFTNALIDLLIPMAVDPDDEVLAAETLCNGLLILPALKYFFTTEQVTFNFSQFALERWIWLQKLLSSSSKRKKVFSALLKRRNINLSLSNRWKKKSRLVYACESIQINLNLGIITVNEIPMPAIPSTGNTISKQIESILSKLKLTHLNFAKTDRSLKSQDGLYEIENSPFPVLFRRIAGTRYKYRPNYYQMPNLRELLLAHRLDLNLTGDQLVIWESEKQTEKQFFIQILENPQALFPFSYDRTRGKWIYWRGDQFDQAVIKTGLNETKHRLDSLNRFCPIDKISCFLNLATGVAERLFLQPFNLLFDIKTDNQGQLKAYCADPQYFGYQIAESQDHPALETLHSYLILENNGEKMILIPPNLWLLAPLWKGASYLGPIGKILTTYANFIDGKDVSYHSYRINEKGDLTSSDPYAVAYLIALQLIQQDIPGSLSTLKQFEILLQSRPVDIDKIFDEIFPLIFIPPDLEHLSYIRLRILSAIGRNRLTQLKPQNKKTKNETGNKSNIYKIASGALFLIDYSIYLSKAHPIKKLSSSQEYFLFKLFFNSADNLIGQFVEDGFAKDLILKYGIINFCENFLFPPHMIKRWEQIKKKYGIKENLINKATKYYALAEKAWGLKGKEKGESYSSRAPAGNGLSSALGEQVENDSTALKNMISALTSARSYGKNRIQLYTKLYHFSSDKIISPSLHYADFNADNLMRDFASYFAVARGEQGEEKRAALAKLLKLFQGGWNEDTAHLIRLLTLGCEGFLPKKFNAKKLLLSKRIYYNSDHSIFAQKKEELENQLSDLKKKIDSLKIEAENKKLELHNALSKAREETFFGEKEADFSFLDQPFKESDERVFDEKTGKIEKIIAEFGQVDLEIAEQLKNLNWEELRIRRNIDSLQKKIDGIIADQDLTKPLENQCPAWFEFFDSLTGHLELRGFAQRGFNTVAGSPFGAVDFICKWYGLPPASEYLNTFASYAFEAEEKPKLLTKENVQTGIRIFQVACQRFQEPTFDPQPYFQMAGNIFQSFKAEETKPVEVAYFPPDYAVLEEDEQWFNDFFEEQFNLLFEEAAVDLKEKRISFFEFTGDNPLFKQHFEKVNDSLNTFYQSRPEVLREVKIKNLGALGNVFHTLHQAREKIKKQLRYEKKKIIESFGEITNSPRYVKEISLDIIWKYIENYQGEFPDQEGPTAADIQLLELSLAKYEHRLSRLNQLEKILQELTNLNIPKDTPFEALPLEQTIVIEEKLEILADLLKAKTMFKFKKTPIDSLRTYLRYQSNSGKLMWKRQVKRLKIQMRKGNENSFNEQACSDGKSTVLIPNGIKTKGDGSRTILMISPAPVSGTLFNVISSLIGDLFSISSHKHHYERGLPQNEETLEALYVSLHSAREMGEPIFLTREDLQSLYAIFIDNLYHFVHVSKKKNKSEENCLLLLQKSLALIYQSGFAIIDEVHSVYDQKQKLNLPIGLPRTIQENYFNAAKGCMAELLKHPKVKEALNNNKLFSLSKKEYWGEIIPEVAQKLTEAYKVSDPDLIEQFINFFCNEVERVPEWLENHPQFKEICLAKGILTILVDQNRKQKSRASVDFGFSKKENNGEFARPYEGNSAPVENSTIQDPYETLIKTFLNLFGEGLSVEQIKKLFKTLRLKALAEMEKREAPYEQTRICQIVNDEKLSAIIMTGNEANDWAAVQKAVKDNSELLFLYARLFIWKQIEFWDYSIQVDSQRFSSLMPEQHAGTATPYNQGTYPPHLKTLNDPQTIGECLHTIFSNCPDLKIKVLKKIEPEKPLTPRQILSLIFDKYLSDPLCSMIIDGGALFTGLSSDFVAREMLRYAKIHRPDIEVVKFFKKDSQDVDQIYSLTDPDGEPVLDELTKYPPEKSLTFIDHPHGVAANIKQKKPGFAVETIGPTHPLYREIQESFREIRDPKKQVTLSPLHKDSLQQRKQMVRFVTIEEVAEMISETAKKQKEAPITVADGFYYGIYNEGEMIARDNFASMAPKINNAPHKLIYAKMLFSDFKKLVSLYEEFETFVFLTPLETDPSKLYGLLPKKIPAGMALDAYESKVKDKFKKSKNLSREELTRIQTSVSEIPRPDLLPVQVTVYHNGSSDFEMGILDQLNQQLQMQNYNQQENDVEQENEQENQLFQKNQVQNQSKTFRYKELKWPPSASLNSLDWLTLSIPEPKTIVKRQYCPFFSMKECLSRMEDPMFNAIAPDFDEALWFPNNWLPLWATGSFALSVFPGCKQQRNLFEVLVHLEDGKRGPKVLRVAPLSVKDAQIWREKMNAEIDKDPGYWQKQEIKSLIWDVHNLTIAAGYQPHEVRLLKKNKLLKKCVVNLKFLNGDVDYKFYRTALKNWFQNSKNPRQLAETFKIIHHKRKELWSRSENKNLLAGSDMDFAISLVAPETY